MLAVKDAVKKPYFMIASKWLAPQKTLLPMPSSPFFSSFFLAHEAIEWVKIIKPIGCSEFLSMIFKSPIR